MKLLCILLLVLHVHSSIAAIDYKTALTNSILYFEGQRSGKLPSNQRATWRGDSALKDGSDVGVDLTGGYYDAGDNVKFNFPMAFTTTLLSWSVVEFGPELTAKNEIGNALAAIRWGTDYFIKCHVAPNTLYVEVGDGDSDHACWERPEDMDTARGSYKIDASHPGSDVAAETAAALAAASIAFQGRDARYASLLVTHARQVGTFQDELVWAAAWLHRATGDQSYLDYLSRNKVSDTGALVQYKNGLDGFMCNLVQKGSNNIARTPGGMVWWKMDNDLQYTTSALLVVLAYSEYLSAAKSSIPCPNGAVWPNELITFTRSQVDYILGSNPKKMSYMVGFGSNYPLQPHHRGASIPSIRRDPAKISCQAGFNDWFNKKAPNPNVLTGAIVGGPDGNDAYDDSRGNFRQAEAATANVAPFVGVLAKFA
ncbi:Endoglucanase 13 [Acorus gramineus]|uniref:Endoglucanase n=1 Tax=Acorus gramineus TaxID=55184 RepID=A0AAV9AKS8_ACOGR|nr:Endoglucanase 13 [Acorus gramineus]